MENHEGVDELDALMEEFEINPAFQKEVNMRLNCSEPPTEPTPCEQDSNLSIAMIVTCASGGEEELTGTREDGRKMKEAFQSVGYHVHLLQDDEVTKKDILDSLKRIKIYYQQGKNKKAFIFAFSGHGCRRGVDNIIVLPDEDTLSLQCDIMQMFSDKSFPCIPKLFFIDACRGSKVLKRKGLFQKSVPRPLYDDEKYRENYLIANATIKEYVSFDSVWMNSLAKKIMDPKYHYEPVTTILDEVACYTGKELQPEYVCRLKGNFSFRERN